MGRYIRNAEVCVKLGPVVVTHGGIAKSPEVEDEGVCGFGAVPPSFRPVEGFAEWFEGVRGWAEKEVRNCAERSDELRERFYGTLTLTVALPYITP